MIADQEGMMRTRYRTLVGLALLLLTLGCAAAMMGTPKSKVGPQMLSEPDFALLQALHETGKGQAYHLLHYSPLTGMLGMALLGDDATSRGEWLKVVLETPYSLAAERVNSARLNYAPLDMAALQSEFAPLDSCYLVADFAGKAGTSQGHFQRLEDRDPNEGALTGKKVIKNIALLVDGVAAQPGSVRALENGGLRAAFPIRLFDCSQKAPEMKIAVVFDWEEGSTGRKEVDLSGRKLRALK